jgi:hypothetical protein
MKRHGTRNSSNKSWWRLLWRNRYRICIKEGGEGDSNCVRTSISAIASMNWNKLQNLSQGAATAVINASQHGIPGVVTQHGFDSWGLPITGGMAMGFAIGFMKG